SDYRTLLLAWHMNDVQPVPMNMARQHDANTVAWVGDPLDEPMSRPVVERAIVGFRPVFVVVAANGEQRVSVPFLHGAVSLLRAVVQRTPGIAAAIVGLAAVEEVIVEPVGIRSDRRRVDADDL